LERKNRQLRWTRCLDQKSADGVGTPEGTPAFWHPSKSKPRLSWDPRPNGPLQKRFHAIPGSRAGVQAIRSAAARREAERRWLFLEDARRILQQVSAAARSRRSRGARSIGGHCASASRKTRPGAASSGSRSGASGSASLTRSCSSPRQLAWSRSKPSGRDGWMPGLCSTCRERIQNWIMSRSLCSLVELAVPKGHALARMKNVRCSTL
jgi:hypothetical protein